MVDKNKYRYTASLHGSRRQPSFTSAERYAVESTWRDEAPASAETDDIVGQSRRSMILPSITLLCGDGFTMATNNSWVCKNCDNRNTDQTINTCVACGVRKSPSMSKQHSPPLIRRKIVTRAVSEDLSLLKPLSHPQPHKDETPMVSQLLHTRSSRPTSILKKRFEIQGPIGQDDDQLEISGIGNDGITQKKKKKKKIDSSSSVSSELTIPIANLANDDHTAVIPLKRKPYASFHKSDGSSSKPTTRQALLLRPSLVDDDDEEPSITVLESANDTSSQQNIKRIQSATQRLIEASPQIRIVPSRDKDASNDNGETDLLESSMQRHRTSHLYRFTSDAGLCSQSIDELDTLEEQTNPALNNTNGFKVLPKMNSAESKSRKRRAESIANRRRPTCKIVCFVGLVILLVILVPFILSKKSKRSDNHLAGGNSGAFGNTSILPTPSPSGRVAGGGELDSSWQQIGQTLLGNAPQDQLGYSIAIAAQGTVMAAGSVEATPVRVYSIQNNTWIQLGQDLMPSVPHSKSVALSSFNGAVVAVSSRNSSKVKVYSLLDNLWSPLGAAISVSPRQFDHDIPIALSADGNVLAMAIPGDYNSTASVSVYTFVVDKWIALGNPIIDEDIDPLATLDIDISDDGMTVAIASSSETNNKASAYHFSNNTWTIMGESIAYQISTPSVSISSDRLAVGSNLLYTFSQASNEWIVIDHEFILGPKVDLQGDVLVVGYVGKLLCFEIIDDVLVQKGETLTAGDSDPFAPQFALSETGRRVVIGTPTSNQYTGSVQVFELT